MLSALLVILALAGAGRGLAKELSAMDFTTEVIADDHVWLVEFYSGMCGSCQEFAPVWESVIGSVQTIQMGKLNIDIPSNMRMAKALGILDQGIPNIQLYAKHDKPDMIMSGDLLSKKEILHKVHGHIKGTFSEISRPSQLHQSESEDSSRRVCIATSASREDPSIVSAAILYIMLNIGSAEEDSWGVHQNMNERRQTRRESFRQASSRRKSFVQVELEHGDQLPDEYAGSQMAVLEMPTVVRAPSLCWRSFRCMAFVIILLLVFGAIWYVNAYERISLYTG